MFKLLYINGEYCPHIICDECNKPIEDTENAIYAWLYDSSDPDNGGTDGQIYILHIRTSACGRIFQMKKETQGYSFMWMHLESFFIWLGRNCENLPINSKDSRDEYV